MKNLYVVVEGQTEVQFFNRLLKPYLIQKGLHRHIQAIPIEVKGGGHGFNNIQHFKNTIEPLLFKENTIISTMIDHYGINSEQKLPNYENCLKQVASEDRIKCMENALLAEVKSIRNDCSHFIPNILRHEMETLFFADVENGFALEDDGIQKEVAEIAAQYPNIEDINNSPKTAPSKRLIAIYEKYGKKYKKITSGVDIIAINTGIEKMLEKSPRFKNWVENLIQAVTKN